MNVKERMQVLFIIYVKKNKGIGKQATDHLSTSQQHFFASYWTWTLPVTTPWHASRLNSSLSEYIVYTSLSFNMHSYIHSINLKYCPPRRTGTMIICLRFHCHVKPIILHDMREEYEPQNADVLFPCFPWLHSSLNAVLKIRKLNFSKTIPLRNMNQKPFGIVIHSSLSSEEILDRLFLFYFKWNEWLWPQYRCFSVIRCTITSKSILTFPKTFNLKVGGFIYFIVTPDIVPTWSNSEYYSTSFLPITQLFNSLDNFIRGFILMKAKKSMQQDVSMIYLVSSIFSATKQADRRCQKHKLQKESWFKPVDIETELPIK